MTNVVKFGKRIEQAVSSAAGDAKQKNAVDGLPFVGTRAQKRKGELCSFPRDFWHNVKSTGCWEKDQSLGSAYAYAALQAIKADNFAPLLGWIVIDMIEHKCPEHIVVGFFQTVADVCLGYHQIPAARVRLMVPK
jgi:hypothetical protein